MERWSIGVMVLLVFRDEDAETEFQRLARE